MIECGVCDKPINQYYFVYAEILSKKLFCPVPPEEAETSPCYELEHYDDYINVRHVCKCNQLALRKLKIKITVCRKCYKVNKSDYFI
jgi:hypothetical protein